MLENSIVLGSFVVFGLLMNLLGYKIFRRYSAMLGVFFGVLFSISVFTLIKIENVFMILLTTAILAILFSVFYNFGLAFTGFTVGYLLTFYLSSDLAFSLIVASFLGIMTLMIEKMIVLITSSIGSSVITFTFYTLLKDLEFGQVAMELEKHIDSILSEPLLVVFWLCLSINGIITQLITIKEKGEK